MSAALARTPLYDWHASHGGRLVDFAGWAMPVQYSSIVKEHQATRSAVGVFDVSHMGRLLFSGSDAGAFLDQIVTRSVLDMRPGRIRYALICNEAGGILDDVLVYRRAGDEAYPFGMVVNAGNREKILRWLEEQQARGTWRVSWQDRTTETAMIAVQGPQARRTMEPIVCSDLGEMKYYTGRSCKVADREGFVSRTGYTGEDGCELIVDANDAEAVWQAVLTSGESCGALPAGLGCRDTLRLEAAMPLYGHELSEQINPIQAGLSFACNLEGRDFVGRDAILRAKENPELPRRIGLKLSGRRAPRQGYAILASDREVGHVTSGTHSPTLQQPLAMGYVERAYAEPGTELAVDIRGASEPATVVPLPFYQRTT